MKLRRWNEIKNQYKRNDIVLFIVGTKIKKGIITTVDYETIEIPEKIQYDILVEIENTIFKHILENSIIKKLK